MPENSTTPSDPSESTQTAPVETGKLRPPSLALAWAVTGAQAVLWGALLWLFAEYWIMLPVRYRWAGIGILSALAALGLIRLVLVHRRYFRIKRNNEGL